MIYAVSSLAGVLIGYAIADYRAKRRLAALLDLLRSDIVNTAAPTTAELDTYLCPRCGSAKMRRHASNEATGLTCLRCGWVRYADPYTHKLWDAPRQPRTIDEIRARDEA